MRNEEEDRYENELKELFREYKNVVKDFNDTLKRSNDLLTLFKQKISKK